MVTKWNMSPFAGRKDITMADLERSAQDRDLSVCSVMVEMQRTRRQLNCHDGDANGNRGRADLQLR